MAGTPRIELESSDGQSPMLSHCTTPPTSGQVWNRTRYTEIADFSRFLSVMPYQYINPLRSLIRTSNLPETVVDKLLFIATTAGRTTVVLYGVGFHKP
jgi:hypothetical protein